jgi:hypothetical protein
MPKRKLSDEAVSGINESELPNPAAVKKLKSSG